jgi:hypothetical protein
MLHWLEFTAVPLRLELNGPYLRSDKATQAVTVY